MSFSPPGITALRPARLRQRSSPGGESESQRNTTTPVTAERRLAALGETLNALEQRFGTWRVTWGELNRLQRRDESKGEQFDDARPSLAIPGVGGADGAVFTFTP